MRTLLLATLATVIVSGSAFARMYKCTVDGKVTYRERPCETGAQESVKLNDNSSMPLSRPERASGDPAGGAGLGERSTGQSARGTASTPAGTSSEPVGLSVRAERGWTAAQVRQQLGDPDATDSTLFHGNRYCPANTLQETWTYRTGARGTGQTVVLCNGTVAQSTLTSGERGQLGPGSNTTGLTGASIFAQRGWSRTEVLERMGQPDKREPMSFNGGTSLCPPGERVDSFFYAGRNGNLNQTVIFCNNSVVDVKLN